MTERTTPLPGGISCDVCRDLAPLVADGVASADSAALVKEHLARCESCRAEFSQICPEGSENQPAPALPAPDERRVLRRVQNKLTLWLLGFLILGLGGSMLVVFSPHSTLALLCFPLVCGVICWFDDFLWRLVPVLAAVAFLLPMPMVKNGPEWSDFGPAWMDRLDYVLTGRLSQVWLAYRLLDVKIAGQVLPDWPALDNSFVFSLYQFGPVVTVLLLVGLGLALWGFAKRGGRVEACCLLAMLVYAYMECQSFHLTTNPAALLLAGAVFAQAPRQWAGVYGPAKQTE